MVNASGWTELMDGDLIGAAFVAYDVPFMGWTVAILFFVFQFMLFLKTRNITLCWVAGLFFASVYVVGATVVPNFIRFESIQVMSVLLVFELAGILYMLVFK